MSGTTKEIAKAAQEVAKTTRKAIGATERLGSFLATVIGEPLNITVGMLTDRLRLMRWQRQLRLVDRCTEILRERRLKGRLLIVPPKLALPIVEYASLEDNDELQDLWANLLVSAMDPAFKDAHTGAFVEIIKQMQPIDAIILNSLYQESITRLQVEKRNRAKDIQEHIYISPSQICIRSSDILKVLPDNTVRMELFEVATDNLVHLGCAALFRDVHIRFHDGSKRTNYDEISITSLGIAFTEACIKGRIRRRFSVTVHARS